MPASQIPAPKAMRNEGLPPARDRTAILGSIAIHCCVLVMLAALPRAAAFPAGDPDERALLASRVTIERAPPRPQPTQRPRPRRALPAGTPIPLVVAVAGSHAHRPMVVAAERRYATPGPARPHAAPHVRTRAALPLLIAQQTLAPVRRPVATAAASTPAAATPSPSAAPTTVPAETTAGLGNLGDTWAARPMPGMVPALRAKIGGHAVVKIDVDEHGKPVSVTVVSGLDDPALRSTVLQMLMTATYIPARCSGLDCEELMTLTI